MNPAIFMFDSPPSGHARDHDQCCGCSGAENFGSFDCNDALEAEKSKIASEIVETGQPYKEIEAIINDSRLVLRIQKLREIEEEWDPPCDCLPGTSPTRTDLKSSDSQSRGVNPTFSSPSKFPASKSNRNRIPESPNPGKTTQRPIDLVENPNMFLLRIQKRSQASDKRRENIDLEFWLPRPYKPKPVEKKKRKLIPENPVEQQKSISMEEKPEKKAKKQKKKK